MVPGRATYGGADQAGGLYPQAGDHSVAANAIRSRRRVGLKRGLCCGGGSGWNSCTAAHYRPDGGKQVRFRKYFSRLADVRFEATRIATAIANGDADVLKLTSADRAAYLHDLPWHGKFHEFGLCL